MGQVYILQVLVLALCSSLGHGASLDACMMVLLSEEFQTPCGALGMNHTRPCLVQSNKDEAALKRAKVIHGGLTVSKNEICAAHTEMGEADCVSVHLKSNQQQNWQWTEWAGTSSNLARRIAVTEGNTNRPCPYEERYFKPEPFTDCVDALNQGFLTSGVYTISPDGATEMQVYCEQQLDGGGWMVFQTRTDGSVDFFQDWYTYKVGFGEPTGEFWLGNDNIHLLTKNSDHQLKVELLSVEEELVYADYTHFEIADEANQYKLAVSGWTGADPPGDGMTYSNNIRFSTKDRDYDSWAGFCARDYNQGAWWYRSCTLANLNGLYGITGHTGFTWNSWKNLVSVKAARMMITRRP